MMTPALRTLREHFPGAELHLLVPEEIAPLFQHLPWLDRVWAMPRQRGRARLTQSWPVIRALRRERFDCSVDFASNDRGAILSRLIGARRRLGWGERGGFWGRKFCYTERVAPETKLQHESVRLARLLSAWQIPPPSSLEPEIRSDPAMDALVARMLPEGAILCHVATSNQKKQWPVNYWGRLYQLAATSEVRLVFTTPTGVREQALMAELKLLAPDAPVLPVVPELNLFLALLKRAKVFISGDTGPLHFAAGLGVPTISLFGPSSPERWAPLGKQHRVLTGSACSCDGSWDVCQSASHCLAAISPERVFVCLQAILAEPNNQ